MDQAVKDFLDTGESGPLVPFLMSLARNLGKDECFSIMTCSIPDFLEWARRNLRGNTEKDLSRAFIRWCKWKLCNYYKNEKIRLRPIVKGSYNPWPLKQLEMDIQSACETWEEKNVIQLRKNFTLREVSKLTGFSVTKIWDMLNQIRRRLE